MKGMLLSTDGFLKTKFKVEREFVVRRSGGNPSSLGPEQLKTLSPIIVRWADGTDKRDAEEEQSVREGKYVWRRSDEYG